MNTPLLSNVDTAGRDVRAFVVHAYSFDSLNTHLQGKLARFRSQGYDVVHRVDFSEDPDGRYSVNVIVSGDPSKTKAIPDQISLTARYLLKHSPGSKPPVTRNSPGEIIARVLNALEGKVESGTFVPLSTLAEWTELPAGRIRAALACYPTVNGGRVFDNPPRFLVTGNPENESSLGYALNPEWVRYSTPQKRG